MANTDHTLAYSIIHATDLTELLNLLSVNVCKLTHADGCVINLYDEDKNELSCEFLSMPIEYDGVSDALQNFKYKMNSNDINVVSFRNRLPIIIDFDLAKNYSKTTSNSFYAWKCKSMAALPFMSGDHILGTILLFKQKQEITEAELAEVSRHLLPIFYRPVLNFLNYSRLKKKEDSIRRVVEEQEHFLKFILDVNNLTSIDSIYHLFCTMILRRFDFDLAGILLLEGDSLVAKKHAILDEKYRERLNELEDYFSEIHYDIQKQDGACLAAMEHNIHVIIPDCAAVTNLPMSVKDKKGLEILQTPRTMLTMPIRKNDKPTGVFWLWSLEKPVQVDVTSLNIIDLLGSFIGTAISNAELYCRVEEQKSEIEKLNLSLQEKVVELHNLATTDKLTELKNFAFFQQELSRRIMEYRRCEKPLCMSLIILDIDHFKRFNDTYGHVAGNIALMDVAGRIAKQARSMDIVCRYGGEEFIVILPRCTLEGAALFAERVRASIEATPVKTDKESVPVTISIGVAEYQPDEDQEYFIERADKALYEAKQSGRNCVKVAL